jgi:hypothetical protein
MALNYSGHEYESICKTNPIVVIKNFRRDEIGEYLRNHSSISSVSIQKDFPSDKDIKQITAGCYDLIFTNIKKSCSGSNERMADGSINWESHYGESLDVLRRIKKTSPNTRIIGYTGASKKSWPFILSQKGLDGIISKTEEYNSYSIEFSLSIAHMGIEPYLDLDANVPYYEYKILLGKKDCDEKMEVNFNASSAHSAAC